MLLLPKAWPNGNGYHVSHLSKMLRSCKCWSSHVSRASIHQAGEQIITGLCALPRTPRPMVMTQVKALLVGLKPDSGPQWLQNILITLFLCHSYAIWLRNVILQVDMSFSCLACVDVDRSRFKKCVTWEAPGMDDAIFFIPRGGPRAHGECAAVFLISDDCCP